MPQLAQTLTSWVEQSAKRVLPQAMMEVKTMRATFPVSMGASPEPLHPTRVKLNHQALQTQAPCTSSISEFSFPLGRPKVLPSLRLDAWCHSSSTTPRDGDRNSMGDSRHSMQIGAASVDSRITQSKSGAAKGSLLRVSVSECSLKTSGELSVTLGSVSGGHCLKGINLDMKPAGDELKVTAQLGATAKKSSCICFDYLARGNLQPDTSSAGHLSKDSESWCVASKSSAMDALKNTMERMVFCVDNASAFQERLEVLFSSGILRPFIQDLVDWLQQAFEKTLSYKIERSASDPEVSPTRWANKNQRRIAIDRRLEMTWAYTQKVVRSLLRELLISLHSSFAEDDKCLTYGVGSSQTSQWPSAKICTEVVEVFTEGLVRQVTALQPKNNPTCLSPSALRASLQSHSGLGSGSTCISSGPPHIIGLRFEGNDYQSLVTILVVKLLLDIHQPIDEEYFVSIPTLSRILSNRVLYEFCGMSGLSKNEAYPPTLTIKKIYHNVYRKLLVEFGTTGELQQALFAQRVSFSKSLVSLLSEELLKQCRKEKAAHLAISNETVMTTASLRKMASGRDRETKVSFFKGRHSSKKVLLSAV